MSHYNHVTHVAVLTFVVVHWQRETDTWEIDFEELELSEKLGAGGYGEVHRAMWKVNYFPHFLFILCLPLTFKWASREQMLQLK